jgi:transposase
MRAAMNAILYLLRTGCPWRYLATASRHAQPSTTSSAVSMSQNRAAVQWAIGDTAMRG